MGRILSACIFVALSAKPIPVLPAAAHEFGNELEYFSLMQISATIQHSRQSVAGVNASAILATKKRKEADAIRSWNRSSLILSFSDHQALVDQTLVATQMMLQSQLSSASNSTGSFIFVFGLLQLCVIVVAVALCCVPSFAATGPKPSPRSISAPTAATSFFHQGGRAAAKTLPAFTPSFSVVDPPCPTGSGILQQSIPASAGGSMPHTPKDSEPSMSHRRAQEAQQTAAIGPMCSQMQLREHKTYCFSAELTPQPQDGVILIQDPAGNLLARAFSHESGPEPPGIVLDTDNCGYFAFLDTSQCAVGMPEADRRVLVRRASTSSVSGAVYAVFTAHANGSGRRLVARRPGGGAVFLYVNMDMLGRVVDVVDVADGGGNRLAQVEQRSNQLEPFGTWQGSPDSLGELSELRNAGNGPRPGACLQIFAGTDTGLVLSAVLAAEKLR